MRVESDAPTSTHRTVTVHLRLTLEAFSLSELIALHVQIAGFAVCMREQATELKQNQTGSKASEPFFLYSLGTKRIAADHCPDCSLHLPTKFRRLGVRVLDARPSVLCLVGIRLLRGSESRPWTVIGSRLVVPREIGVSTRTGKLWVMAASGGVNGGVVLLL